MADPCPSTCHGQNPKGGGLSTDFGAAQQIGGVQKTSDFIQKATWSLAIIIAVLSIFMTLRYTTTPQVQEANTDNTENVEGDQAGGDVQP